MLRQESETDHHVEPPNRLPHHSRAVAPGSVTTDNEEQAEKDPCDRPVDSATCLLEESLSLKLRLGVACCTFCVFGVQDSFRACRPASP